MTDKSYYRWRREYGGQFRDQFLDSELFYTLNEARILIEQWRIHYNTIRPHQSIGRRPPAPVAWSVNPATDDALRQSLFPPPHPNTRGGAQPIEPAFAFHHTEYSHSN